MFDESEKPAQVQSEKLDDIGGENLWKKNADIAKDFKSLQSVSEFQKHQKIMEKKRKYENMTSPADQ